MSDTPKTVRVKAWGEGQGDFVLINQSDFDASAHELFDGPEAPLEPAPGGDDGAGGDGEEMTINKGPRGLWYVYRGTERVSGGFASEAEASAHMAELGAGA